MLRPPLVLISFYVEKIFIIQLLPNSSSESLIIAPPIAMRLLMHCLITSTIDAANHIAAPEPYYYSQLQLHYSNFTGVG